MPRIIITHTNDVDPMLALEHVKDVVESGRISEDRKSYCAATAFSEGILVLAARTPRGSDSFSVMTICRELA